MGIQKGIFGDKAVLKHVTIDGVRLHLRIDEQKLWINGYYVLFLNKSATKLLEEFIESCYRVPKQNVMPYTLKKLKKRFIFASKEQIEKDLHQIIGIINTFARNEIPSNLVGMKYIETENRTAPNRMDLSLTYNCNNNCPHCYLPEGTKFFRQDLTTNEWKHIIKKLWVEAGVPQIVFTGGECTLRKDLIELIAYSKKFITGVITNGTNISPKLARDMKTAELDWIQITLEAGKREIHDKMQGREGAFNETIHGIVNCLNAGLQVSVNCTITQDNKQNIRGLIALAKHLGVNIVSANAIINSGRGQRIKDKKGINEKELKIILKDANDYAKEKGIEFNWFLPTCYKNLDPIKLGFGQRRCSACSVNMMIEPNGDVIPCQSWTQNKLGNIFTDKWKNIWNSKEAIKIRNFGYAPKECEECSQFSVCGGACPLEQINCNRCKR